jgi:hypothetical protein
MKMKCAICKVEACREEPGSKAYPNFCPTSQETQALTEARAAYDEAETLELARAAARTEAAG